MNSEFNRNLFIDRPPKDKWPRFTSWVAAAIAGISALGIVQAGTLMHIYNKADQDIYEFSFATSADNKIELRIAGVTITDQHNCQVLVASNLEGSPMPPDINFEKIPTCVPGDLYETIRYKFLSVLVAFTVSLLLSVGLSGVLLHHEMRAEE